MQQYNVVRKLIVESPMYDLKYETIQENRSEERKLMINGRYLMLNRINKNRRIYESSEMIPAIEAFHKDFIMDNRGGGECNHSPDPEVKLDRLAHKIVSLTRDPQDEDFYIGRSEIITANPPGRILEGLIKHNMKFGLSSKALGIIEEGSDGNKVKKPILLSVDAVYDPSASPCFINGIYENREYIIGNDGKAHEAFTQLTKDLSKYPSRHSDAIKAHIVESFKKMLANI